MANWQLNKAHKEIISNRLNMAKILKQTWKIINVKQSQTESKIMWKIIKTNKKNILP